MIQIALQMQDRKYIDYFDFCLKNNLKPSHGNSLIQFAMQKRLNKGGCY